MATKITAKKTKNRKEINKNKKNQGINRSYTFAAKALIRKAKRTLSLPADPELFKTATKDSLLLILGKKLFSVLDKATKKGAFHKNKASRKKSWFAKVFLSKASI